MQLDAQPVEGTDDEFSQAFASFVKDGEPPASEGGDNAGTDSGGAAADAGVAAGSDGGGAGDAVADGGNGETGAAPAEGAESGAAADGAAGAAPAAEAPAAAQQAAEGAQPQAQNADDILNRLADLVKDKKDEPAPAPAAQEETQPIFSQEEQEFLTSYEKDWSDVSKAEELKRRAFGAGLVQYVFDQIAPKINEMRELTEALANRAHFSDLEQKIGPIDDAMSTQINSWVDQQPSYLQTAYKQVLTTGTVSEVADLVDRFKKETGAAPAPAPAPSKGGSELSEATKQAAASLAPVSSKRSQIEQQDDPNDFGAAFAKFSEMFKE